MDVVLALVIGLGLAAACGFRVFLPPLLLGALSHTGHFHLSHGFEWIGSPLALAIFGTAALVEVIAYFIPALDNLLDAVATPAAAVAGTVAAASVLGEMTPALRWTVALIAGGGMASLVQLSTVAVRGASTLLTGGTANHALAGVELAGSGVLTFVAIFVPLLALVLVLGVLVAVPWLLFKLGRRVFQQRKPAPDAVAPLGEGADMNEPREDLNLEARRAWNANARFWDARMREGNDFFNKLAWPACERLLTPRAGERMLDVACGNGLTSRRLARAGAQVLAFDFSEEMIAAARERAPELSIDYRVLDATDGEALAALGPGSFDGALCSMALMDMAELRPLMTALAALLRPAGRFVFSTVHPCFNNTSTVHIGEHEDREGELVTTYSVKISRYMSPRARMGLAMPGQPVPHPYFDRPLASLLGTAFEAGFVLDGLEERAFEPGTATGSTPLSWSGLFSEIPPVLVARLRPGGA